LSEITQRVLILKGFFLSVQDIKWTIRYDVINEHWTL